MSARGRMHHARVWAAAAAGVLLTFCSGPALDPPACRATDATVPAAAAQVDYGRDVAPIFAAACAFSSCHGAASGGNQGVYLGSDAARVARSAVGVKSATLTTMAIVEPGVPERSFLIHKLDGDTCTLDAQCAGGSCGERMPKDNPRLDDGARTTLRTWIAQGARVP